MKNIKLQENPYLLFSPFLIAYIIYIIIFNPADLATGDSLRYLDYAKNLIHGFYSTPAPNISLINGPGYPIILVPFLLLKLPLMSITIANAFFYYFSVILLFKALKEIVSFRVTFIFSLGWASYIIAYQNLQFIMTETFTYFIISVLIYTVINVFNSDNKSSTRKYIILSGFVFGFLVLTKMIFGYVLMIMLLGSVILRIANRKNLNYRKILIITALAFLTTSPYLLYTYNLTGRLFYWGMGNDNFWCMTTPYEDEYGDFKIGTNLNPIEAGNYNIQGADSILVAHHQEEYNEINKYSGIEKDDAYKRLAIQNIKSHPYKYAKNIVYNIGRLIFHYPFSYAIQRPIILIILPINGILLTLLLFCLIPTIINWKKLPVYIKFLMILTLLYLGGSILVNVLIRMFTIIVPILLVWIAYIFQHTVKINLKFKDNDPSPSKTLQL